MNALSTEITRRWKAAQVMARAAGQSTLELFQSERIHIELKSDLSPVTEADRQAERILRESILEQFPHDGILGEELGTVEGSTDFRWVLDPIDGTKSFIAGVPLYGTMVGVEHGDRAVLGAIHFPALDELVFSAAGSGSWKQHGEQPAQRIEVSDTKQLSESRLMVTDSKAFYKRNAAVAYRELERVTAFCRSWGDCFGYFLVARGRADVMIDPALHSWDAVAVHPIIEEAGGVFCDWHGRQRTDSGDAIAANRWLMPQVLALLEKHYPASDQ